MAAVPAPPPAPTVEQIQGTNDASKTVSLRGRKKHKCSVCGNIARSRCPFHSCKGCCVKAKNPCYIHVIKPSTAGESAQGPSTSTPPHPPPVIPTFVRHPLDGLRTKTFKPIGPTTRKEAAFVNIWRFHKLKDHIDGLLATEDEAFDRYMQNVSLLKEVFASNSENLQGLSPEGHFLVEGSLGSQPVDEGVDVASITDALRVRLRNSAKRKEAHKQRLKRGIDRSLQKLHTRGDQGDAVVENDDLYMGGFTVSRREMKRIKVQSVEGKERLKSMDVFSALLEKVKHMESKEDLEACLKAYEDNFVKKEISRLQEPNITNTETPQEGMLGVGEGENAKDINWEKGQDVASAFVFTASHKARVDVHGVLKGYWKVDMDPQVLSSVEIPSSTLLSL